ncbi:YgjV family protein [Dactylosporangium sp. NPDC005572]|uniref:YgjV family protein n=1 Tax=Dactylosporangium sp. NPDC005572 TaxID=3156889 RepID=UPI0033AF2737
MTYWLEALGWAGSALLVWSLLQTRQLRLRRLNLAGSVVLVAYNSLVHVWPMVGLNVVLTVINAWHLYRMLRTRHDENTYAVVEVAADDAFLAHVLRVHWADIARFNPDFTYSPDSQAFVTLYGDEVVGVLLLRPLPDGQEHIAQVDLDYVTPRYRDLSPGEFVFRRSGQLTARGYRQVLTPPGMLAPYYGRLGFEKHGDSYRLDLPSPD